MEVLEVKKTVKEIKNALERLISSLLSAEERISEPEVGH